MRMASKLLHGIDLSRAASTCLEAPLDRLPGLVSDRALGESKETLIKYTRAIFTAGEVVPSEIITMPKKKFGHRPVIISSLPSRLIYEALVDSVSEDLEPDSRRQGAWDSYESFAADSESEYIVEIDIAGCYEFIDHDRLRQEIVTRTLDADTAEAIRAYLGECSINRRGLPQLSAASDKLADLYLSVMQRQLMRKKLEVARYADDFRVRIDGWERANDVIEDAARFARSLGLILSYEKTRITRTSVFRERIKARQELEQRYLDNAKTKMTLFQIVGADYEDQTIIEIPPDETTAFIESMHKIVFDWRVALLGTAPDVEHRTEESLRQLLPVAITALQKDRRIDNKVLCDLVYKEPVRLERVCKYVIRRSNDFGESSENADLLRSIISAGRLSPWAKIWILHTLAQIGRLELLAHVGVKKWLMTQIMDRHETVRAEAAWTLAKLSILDDRAVTKLIREATPVTACGIAASIGKQGNLNKSLVNSIVGESPLIKAAYKWGESQ